MIAKTPSDLDQFPIPVSGQEIPRGWFARLVTFINSLVLHGDNHYLAVKRTMNGTTISPTKKLIDALNRPGTPPSAGGGGGGGLFPSCIEYENTTSFYPGYYYQANQDCWLMGCIYMYHSWMDSVVPDYKIRYKTIGSNNNILFHSAFNMMLNRENFEIWFPVCVPIPANKDFYIDEQIGSSSHIYPNFYPFCTNGTQVQITQTQIT